MVTIYFFAVAE